MKIGILRIVLVLSLVISNIGCDQVSKNYASTQLRGTPSQSFLNGLFHLTYAENKGAFLSLGSDFSESWHTIGLKILPVILLVALLLYTLFSKSLNLYQIIAFSFILGGGISNIYDRLLYGKVVDFMKMGNDTLHTGIFNFADVSIMVGMFMMLPFLFSKN